MNFTEVPALQFKALSISAEDDGASAATVVDRAFGGAFASASMAELRMKQLQQQQILRRIGAGASRHRQLQWVCQGCI